MDDEQVRGLWTAAHRHQAHAPPGLSEAGDIECDQQRPLTWEASVLGPRREASSEGNDGYSGGCTDVRGDRVSSLASPSVSRAFHSPLADRT